MIILMSFEDTIKKSEEEQREHESHILGLLSSGSNWTESIGRKIESGEYQFFHSTYAYNIDPQQYRQLLEQEEFILDRRMFVDSVPQLGYGKVNNPDRRKFQENPDELVLFRFVTNDEEPFTLIQREGLDLKDVAKGGFRGGPEPRFDPRYLGYALKLKKIGEERLENYNFPHRVITFEVTERIPVLPD